jgi:succinate dehydrogenase/fumarate reductase flavoprotein subunit
VPTSLTNVLHKAFLLQGVRRNVEQSIFWWCTGEKNFYAAGQTGQQLLIGAYQAQERQVALGNVKQYSRHEMLDVVIIDGKARGIIARNLVTGELERHFGHAVLLCTGGYGNVFTFQPMPWAAM